MRVLQLFFFQAEDGIRDADVTGVQTCALPILLRSASRICARPNAIFSVATTPSSWLSGRNTLGSQAAKIRSEERRVGKEWGDRRERHRYKKKVISVRDQTAV